MTQPSAFRAAFWSGLTAPLALHARPTPYTHLLTSGIDPFSFGAVARYLTDATSRTLGDPALNPDTSPTPTPTRAFA